MRAHSRVASLDAVGDGLYHLKKKDGKSLIVFICDCYSYGMAQYIETTSKVGKVDVVIINSQWCGYTRELKIQCRKEAIGLFDVRDFMAALNHRDYWLYLNEWDTERFKACGLI
ncbi:hypothetical protein [Sphingosinicella sp.]|uniref:hypothetical protein n=1 Tax=Sphingosinicella sp. TaxID=1917971 RepID=UPI0035AE9E28